MILVGVRVELGKKLIGKIGEILREIAEEVFGMEAWGDTAGEGARLADIAGSRDDAEAARGELSANAMLLILKADERSHAGKIFDGVDETGIFDHGDANRVEFGLEEIGAMTGGFHPGTVELGSIRGISDVFGDDRKMDASADQPAGERRLAGILVGDDADAGHKNGMIVSGAGEVLVPLERGKVTRDAFAVGGVKQDAFLTLGATGAGLGG